MSEKRVDHVAACRQLLWRSGEEPPDVAERTMAEAQVHATLALVDVTAGRFVANPAAVDRAARSLYEDERSRAVDAAQWDSWDDLNVAGKNWWRRRAESALMAAFGGDET